jgi:nucleoside-diphosphate-sugar epimerase
LAVVDGGSLSAASRSRLVVGNGRSACDSASAVIGITAAFSCRATAALLAGTLTTLLEEFQPLPLPVHLVIELATGAKRPWRGIEALAARSRLMGLKVLFVGGTGNISLPCVAEAAKAGCRVSVFNRGATSAVLPEGVDSIAGDIGDARYRDLGRGGFDVVCQFIAFTPDQVLRDIELFSGGATQYIFISSASVYQKPPRRHVISEKTPAVNPYWPYSQNKIACEAALRAARGLTWTIVRPSHTVRTMLPTVLNEGDALANRLLAGRPVIVAGDGATPWTLTRCADFAVPFVRLFGKSAAFGETFHITSDNAYSWNDITNAIAAGLGVSADIVHVPTDTLIRYLPDSEGPLMGDKTWAALFDNTKVKQVVGDFHCVKDLGDVLAEPIASFKVRLKSEGPRTSDRDALMDRIAREQRSLGASTA